MLERALGPQVNIKDLTVSEFEAPSRKEFDPRHDLTEEDWQRIQTELNFRSSPQAIEEDGHDEFAAFAIHTQTLAKVAGRELTVSYPRGFFGYYSDSIPDFRKDKNWEGIAQGLVFLRRLFPDRFKRAKTNKIDERYIKGFFDEALVNKNPFGIASHAVQYLLIYPEKRANLSLGNNELEKIKELMKLLGAQGTSARLDSMASLGANARLIFPGTISSQILDQRYWPKLKESWRKLSNVSSFVRRAEDLTILAADEVGITKEGLHIVMDKPRLARTSAQMPQRRNF